MLTSYSNEIHLKLNMFQSLIELYMIESLAAFTS